MYQEAIANIKTSIFPIFYEVRQDGRTGIGVSGSGFFIGEDGLFVTANHVITDTPPGARILYAGNVPENPIPQPIEFEEVYSDAVRDIYFGRVDNNDLEPLDLGDESPQAGKSICLCGYPLARLGQNEDGSINVNNVRPYWQPTFLVDGITANNIQGRNYQGFITQHTSLKGMSGGPVFDMDGIVYGIDVATLTREIPQGNGDVKEVPNGVVIGVETLHEIMEKIE